MAKVGVTRTDIRGCLQDFALREVLAELGLKDSELKDLHEIAGVKWKDCDVIKIRFPGRSELHGQLSDWLQRLTNLEVLVLSSANVTGSLQALKHNARMRRVDLSGTQVSGDIDIICNLESLKYLDLSNTQVAGELINQKNTSFGKELTTLMLADTNISFMLSQDAWACPKLVLLDLSRSPIKDTSLGGFLRTLGNCNSLGTVMLAGCNLTGTIPDIADLSLANSLVSFDASFNHLSQVEAIPPRCQRFSVSGNDGIGFKSGVLKKALADYVSLDLRDLSLASPSEAKELFDLKLVQKTKHRILVEKGRGYACSDIANHRFEISPDKFAPHELCACLPGWSGNSTSCHQCPVNTFKEDEEGECKPCPAGSKAPKGSTTRDECKCKLGDLFNTTGTLMLGH